MPPFSKRIQRLVRGSRPSTSMGASASPNPPPSMLTNSICIIQLPMYPSQQLHHHGDGHKRWGAGGSPPDPGKTTPSPESLIRRGCTPENEATQRSPTPSLTASMTARREKRNHLSVSIWRARVLIRGADAESVILPSPPPLEGDRKTTPAATACCTGAAADSTSTA